jgi:hypothetical protein
MGTKKKPPQEEEKETMELHVAQLVPGQFVQANDGEFRKIIKVDPVMNIPRVGDFKPTEQVVLYLDKTNRTELELRSGVVLVKVA